MPALPRVARTAARTLAIMLCVVASLLTFPAGIPWMLVAWLAWYTVARAQGYSGILLLLGGPVIAALKGTYPTPGLIVFAATTLLTAIVLPHICRNRPDVKYPRVVSNAILWMAFGFLIWDWHAGIHSSRRISLLPESSIACVGDSLTAPEGTDGGYPEALSQFLPNRVVNLGQDGITSADALGKLPRLREAAPRIVVIELGGHDFLKGHGRASAKANLERLIAGSREVGAEVILIEVPREFIFDPWFGLERQIARELELELVPDSVIRRFVLFSPHAPPGMWLPPERLLSADGLHPNRRGKQVMARVVAEAVARVSAPAHAKLD